MEPIDKRYRDYLYAGSKAPYDETLSGTLVFLAANLSVGNSANSSMLFVQESVEEIVYKLNKLEIGVA
jgi:hypothetical protein